jgi:hypothetical protein
MMHAPVAGDEIKIVSTIHTVIISAPLSVSSCLFDLPVEFMRLADRK